MKNKIILIIILTFLISCSKNNISYKVKPGNEGFMLRNSSEVGVLLTHGFEASPHEVKELAEYLSARNITVLVVRLKGHGTNIKELDKVKWQEWYKDYEDAYNKLANKTKKVIVGGYSLGGALALYLAEQKDTAGVISLASPVELKDKRADYAWLIKYFKKYEYRNITNEEKEYYYENISVEAVEQLTKFIKTYKKDLSKIDEPILIMQFSDDTRISSGSAYYIYKNLNSKNKKIVIINATGHNLLTSKYKDAVHKEVYNFIKKI